MSNRKKRLERQKEGLFKQAAKHRLKAETQRGRKDTTREYWKGEAERFEKRALQREGMLRKISKIRKKKSS